MLNLSLIKEKGVNEVIKKCPHCEFEPIQEQLICPSCGLELNENISKQIKEDQTTATSVEESKEDPNDNINWSNYQEVSLGSVMEHFNEANDEDAGSSTSEFSDNPILEAYLRRHRDGDEGADKDLVAAIAKQKELASSSEEEDVERSFLIKEKEVISSTSNEKKQPNELEEPLSPVVEKEVTTEKESSVVESVAETTPLEEESTEKVLETTVAAKETKQEELEGAVPKDMAEEKESKVTETVDVEEISKVETPEETKAVLETSSVVEKEAASLIPEPEIKEEVVLKERRDFERIDPAIPEEIPAAVIEEQKQENTGVSEPPIEQAPKKRNKKKLYLLTAAGILLAAGGGWLYVDAQQKAEIARQEQIQQDKDFAALAAEIEGFYLDEEQQFVKPEKTTAELKKLMDQLPAFKQQENYSKIQTLSQKLHKKMVLIDTINSSFTSPIIVGDSLNKKVHIKSTDPIDTELLTEKTVFAIVANEALQLGKIELQQVKSAQEAVAQVASFYRDGKLTAELSRKDFDAAKKQVTDLFEIAEKETLLAELKPIEKALIAREKVETEARVAAERKAAEERATSVYYYQQQQQQQQSQQPNITKPVQKENPGQEILNRDTPRNSNNLPIISSRQSDIDDVDNPGWAWAPGVYEKFIKTVLDRGYVVPDGFYLEPVRIENGEGYYHLYATSNKSKLLAKTPKSALPMYLVTVNAKTGYFKGNGSN